MDAPAVSALCPRSKPSRRRRLAPCLLLVLALLPHGGCANTNWVRLRGTPDLPLARELQLFSWRGPQPTPRTQQLLRRYDLLRYWDDDRAQLLAELMQIAERRATPEHIFGVAEIAYISGQRAQREHQAGAALDLYAIAVAHAYQYLLSAEFDPRRNPYDPQFRQASDVYNGALEGVLRVVHEQGQLHPGGTHVIASGTQQYQLSIVCCGPWNVSDIADLKFVSDYEVQGLTNHYRTYGLGVPLIAVHSRNSGAGPAEAYYAPGMSFPVTAFLRVLPESTPDAGQAPRRHECVLELHDPLAASEVNIDGRQIPLETDLSTPLAYSLNDPIFRQANGATRGLLNADRSRQVQGLYLLEPYDPQKIPVLMVHGLWSSLVTWMDMFNDLRGTPEIRDHYQFWFYLYPTGQPFWITAAQLRQELAEARRRLDPEFQSPALDQAILVGHSMGGLVARLQVLESRDDFWQLMSEQPISQLQASSEVESSLRRVLFFGPNPAVRRVITIATPYRGSRLSNGATQWLGRRLIQLPESLLRMTEQLANADRRALRQANWQPDQTSIEALSPDSPFLEVMRQATVAPWVRCDNVVGRIPAEGVWTRVAKESDGVVPMTSAHLEGADSELVVEADHVNIHRNPRTILEVQRILLEHLEVVGEEEMQRLPAARISRLPAIE